MNLSDALSPHRLARRAVGCGLAGVLGLAVAAHAAAPPTVSEVPVPLLSGTFPTGIASGPDGNLWITEADAPESIVRLTLGGTADPFAVGSGTSSPDRIVTGPDGRLWFVDQDTDDVGAITTAGVVTPYSAGIRPGVEQHGIAVGADGRLWFSQAPEPSGAGMGPGAIGAITTSGTIQEYTAGITGQPNRIAAGPDGAVWFTENYPDEIGRISTSGTVTEFAAGITAGANVEAIAAGPDGNLWFTEEDGARIGRITPSGTVTEFPTGAAPGTHLRGIVAGPDGNLWFTERDGGGPAVGNITTAGVVTILTGLTPGSRPDTIIVGPDGNLWFTESAPGRLGHVVLPPSVAPTAPGATPSGSGAGTNPVPTGTALPLACSGATVAILDVHRDGAKVSVGGIGLPAYVGSTVTVRASSGGAKATALIGPAQTFTAKLPLPSAPQRAAVRYTATVAGRRSVPLKLERDLVITSQTATRSGVIIKGTVTGGHKGQAVEIAEETGCTKRKIVATPRLDAHRAFTVTLARPTGGATLAFYRATAAVGRAKTYTLPLAVPAV